MPTILSFLSGRQITNDSGVPQAGAKVYHYRAGTTTNLTVWQNSGATVPHAQPVICDAGGFVPLVYVDDTFNWKIIVTTAADVILPQYNFDNLQKAPPATPAATYALAQFPWNQVSAAGSPVTLTAADAGKAYEADTTGGNVEFDLPAAGSMPNGTGFIFKKTTAANSMILDPNGAETIDGVSISMAISRQYQVVEILSNVAEWYVARTYDVLPNPTVQRFTSGTAQTYTPATGVKFIRARMVGGGGGGAAATTNNGTAGGTSTFGAWTTIGGAAGTPSPAGGAGGTGGATGTGTLITRIDGANGDDGDSNYGGAGGANPFGGRGGGKIATSAGLVAKANTGGGGGGGVQSGVGQGGGGGAGEYVEFFMSAAQIGANQTYTVGGGGAGGAAGSQAGGNGAAGVIIVEEYY